jgi:hypothetical protein
MRPAGGAEVQLTSTGGLSLFYEYFHGDNGAGLAPVIKLVDWNSAN